MLGQKFFGTQLDGRGIRVDYDVRGRKGCGDGVLGTGIFVFRAVESHQTASADGKDAEVAGRRAGSLARWEETAFFRSLQKKEKKKKN